MGLFYCDCYVDMEANGRTCSSIYTYHRDFVMSTTRPDYNVNAPILIRLHGDERGSGSGIFGIENNEPMISTCGSLL